MGHRWAHLGGRVTAIGRFRIYFNRHGAAPLVWCVALENPRGPELLWELAVPAVETHERATTVYAPKATADDVDGKPSAWFVCEGRLEIGVDGTARITKP